MAKAMIVTVGAQAEQIIFALNAIKPRFLGFLATKTAECKRAIETVRASYSLPLTNCRVLYTEDRPGEIGLLIRNFASLVDWFDAEEVSANEILVDSTGGRKWMSAGATMYASFLGLEMIYVDVKYENGRPKPETMKIMPLGNAYEQVGFLEEEKADRLFSENNYQAAGKIYAFLQEKMSDPRKVEIKKIISDGYLAWSQFQFREAREFLDSAVKKIGQYGLLTEMEANLKTQVDILTILAKNDEPNVSYFNLIGDREFSEKVLHFLYTQAERCAEAGSYDLAVVILYRILEFIGQVKLAGHGIDTNRITPHIRKKYDTEFRRITKSIFGAETEIPDRIALMHGWILLYCIQDSLVGHEKENFLEGLREQIKTRDLLWIEHRNQTVDQKAYRKFKGFVESWIRKWKKNFKEDNSAYLFIRFSK